MLLMNCTCSANIVLSIFIWYERITRSKDESTNDDVAAAQIGDLHNYLDGWKGWLGRAKFFNAIAAYGNVSMKQHRVTILLIYYCECNDARNVKDVHVISGIWDHNIATITLTLQVLAPARCNKGMLYLYSNNIYAKNYVRIWTRTESYVTRWCLQGLLSLWSTFQSSPVVTCM